MPAGDGGVGKSTGRILRGTPFGLNVSMDPGKIARNGPLATKALCRWTEPVTRPARGGASPHLQNASVTRSRDLLAIDGGAYSNQP
jgi:hypothetical protein